MKVNMFARIGGAWWVLLLSVSMSEASVNLSISGVPTVGLDGYTTYTFTATAGADEKIIGFDFAGGAGTYGIGGPMNQLNPFGQSTVFGDANLLAGAAGLNMGLDSQFNVLSTKGIAIRPEESANSLKAAFNYLPANIVSDASNTWNFLQVVSNAPDLSSILYNGTLTVRGSDGLDYLSHVSNYAAPPVVPPLPPGLTPLVGGEGGGVPPVPPVVLPPQGPGTQPPVVPPTVVPVLPTQPQYGGTSSIPTSVDLSIISAPTAGLDGYTTYTFKALAGQGEKIIGFDFAGGNGDYGVRGPMNQLNPLGQQSVFSDVNDLAAVAGASAAHDSQFNVLSTKGLAINASESADALQAAFNYFPASEDTDASNEWDFLQIVSNVTDLSQILYNGTLTVRGTDGVARLAYISNYAELPQVPVPGEPPAVVVDPPVAVGDPPAVIIGPVEPVVPDPLPVQPTEPTPTVPPLVAEPIQETPNDSGLEIAGPPETNNGQLIVSLPWPGEPIDIIVVPVDPSYVIDPVLFLEPINYGTIDITTGEWVPWTEVSWATLFAHDLTDVVPVEYFSDGLAIDAPSFVAYDGGLTMAFTQGMNAVLRNNAFTNGAISYGAYDAATDGDLAQVPEPASWWLVAVGVGWFVNAWRRRIE